MNKPPLVLLETFKHIVEASSFAKAAEQLNLTQSALSMQLRKLESFFDQPLFDLRGKKKVPSAFGRLIYEESLKILQIYNSSFIEIHKKYAFENHQLLKIGGRKELFTFASLKINFPGRIEFISMSSTQAIDQLKQQKIDIALTRHKPNSTEFVAKDFLQNSTEIMIHKKFLNKSRSSEPDLHFFKSIPYIAYSNKFDLIEPYLRHFKLLSEELNLKYICEDWITIKNLIEEGLGFSIVPSSLKSTSSAVEHIICKNISTETIKYYFVFNKSLKKLPAYSKLFTFSKT